MDQRTKDPIRVATGRLGGLTTAARGRHVTAPGRAAWEAKLAEEYGITAETPEHERRRRMDAAMRVRMASLARKRWSKPKKSAGPDRTGPALGGIDRGDTSSAA